MYDKYRVSFHGLHRSILRLQVEVLEKCYEVKEITSQTGYDKSLLDNHVPDGKRKPSQRFRGTGEFTLGITEDSKVT